MAIAYHHKFLAAFLRAKNNNKTIPKDESELLGGEKKVLTKIQI